MRSERRLLTLSGFFLRPCSTVVSDLGALIADWISSELMMRTRSELLIHERGRWYDLILPCL